MQKEKKNIFRVVYEGSKNLNKKLITFKHLKHQLVMNSRQCNGFHRILLNALCCSISKHKKRKYIKVLRMSFTYFNEKFFNSTFHGSLEEKCKLCKQHRIISFNF